MPLDQERNCGSRSVTGAATLGITLLVGHKNSSCHSWWLAVPSLLHVPNLPGCRAALLCLHLRKNVVTIKTFESLLLIVRQNGLTNVGPRRARFYPSVYHRHPEWACETCWGQTQSLRLLRKGLKIPLFSGKMSSNYQVFNVLSISFSGCQSWNPTLKHFGAGFQKHWAPNNLTGSCECVMLWSQAQHYWLSLKMLVLPLSSPY